MNNAAKTLILATSLSALHNYFDNSNYFSDLYQAKILDFSANPFFRASKIKIRRTSVTSTKF